MKKITAHEARQIAGPTVQERVNDVYPLIRKAAEERKRFICLDDWWANEGYGRTDAYKQACALLEADGFKVKFYYEELSVVQMYTIVEW